MKSGIYQILNTVNGKRYIGSSVRITGRFYIHKCKLKQNYHTNKKLQNAYNKYGKESFVYSVLEFCKENHLIEKEQKYLNFFGMDNLYNLLPFAYSPRGYKQTEEFKIARRAFRHTDEAKQRISKNMKGGNSTSFKKGQIPINKGTKGLTTANKTSFKKGDLTWNKGLKGIQPYMNLTGLEKGRGLFKGTKGILKAKS